MRSAPIEIGNRVWRDGDSDGIQITVNRRWPAWRCNCLLRWHHRAGDGHHRGRQYLLFFLGFRTKLNEQPQLWHPVGSQPAPRATVQIALNQAPLDGLTLTASSNSGANSDSRDSDGLVNSAYAQAIVNLGSRRK
ncbi:MAG: hypothetical protein R2932_55410 [Caldilineaceae bacterium]